MHSTSILFVALGLVGPSLALDGGRTSIVSRDSNGDQCHGECAFSTISADGRYVAFLSWSQDLVPNDTNMVEDCFVRDRLLGTTVRVSVGTAGAEANARSAAPVISGNGRYVAFVSHASNLVPGDINNVDDVFLYDLQTGITSLVSVSSTGAQQSAGFVDEMLGISHDGTRIVFASEAQNLAPIPVAPHRDVFLRDTTASTTELVSYRFPVVASNGLCHRPTISANGQFVAFESYATNLAAGDTDTHRDIHLANLTTHAIERISVGDQGQNPNGHSLEASVSGDGRYVVFASEATNLVPNDVNFVTDVFLRDRVIGTTRLLSRNFVGNPADGASTTPVVADDGTHVLFRTRATNIVQGDLNGGDADLVLIRFAGAAYEIVTVSTAGRPTNANTGTGDLSDGGQFICFTHPENHRLEYGDGNSGSDVFLRDRTVAWPLTYCPVGVNSLGCVAALDVSGTPSASSGSGFVLSSNGILNRQTIVVFYSLAGSDDFALYAGTICLAQPWVIGPVGFSGGTGAAGTNCSGAFAIDVNAYLAAAPAGAFVSGTTVWAQAIHRDPGFHPARGAVLTDAVVFRVGP